MKFITYYFIVLLFSYFGILAQSVEQRTENPCVPGSIPGDTTRTTLSVILYLYLLIISNKS